MSRIVQIIIAAAVIIVLQTAISISMVAGGIGTLVIEADSAGNYKIIGGDVEHFKIVNSRLIINN